MLAYVSPMALNKLPGAGGPPLVSPSGPSAPYCPVS